MPDPENPYLFVGPSAHDCDLPVLTNGSFHLRPPVKRDDLPRLVRAHKPSTIILVDGLFHQCLSVGHAEIRDAISKGWEVWGGCSIGAIRACEMAPLGMKGFGKVFQRYMEEKDFRDDEVALIHGPIPPYPPLSEPLVHLRVALEELQQHRLLSSAKAKSIVQKLKSLWYGKRTLALFRSLVHEAASPKHRTDIETILSSFDRFRIKTLDLQEFLRDGPYSGQRAH